MMWTVVHNSFVVGWSLASLKLPVLLRTFHVLVKTWTSCYPCFSFTNSPRANLSSKKKTRVTSRCHSIIFRWQSYTSSSPSAVDCEAFCRQKKSMRRLIGFAVVRKERLRCKKVDNGRFWGTYDFMMTKCGVAKRNGGDLLKIPRGARF